MYLKRHFAVLFTACFAFSSQTTADTITNGLEQAARDVGNGVVRLLNTFGSGKLSPDNIELLGDSKVALSFEGQRFNNPCGIEIFWGDGSSEKFRVEKEAYKTGFTLEHQYERAQDYKIEINGKVIFRGLKTVVNCPGNFVGNIALGTNPVTPTQPSTNQAIQTPSLQSEVTLANAERIKVLEAELANKQEQRISELEAQLEAQANEEKIQRLEKELAAKQAKRIAELESQLSDSDLDGLQLASDDVNSPPLKNDSPTEASESSGKPPKLKIPSVPMPSLKGKQMSSSANGDWAHELWCDSRFGQKDRYTSLWKYKGTPVNADKFKERGQCRALIVPDFVMTKIIGQPQRFPSGDSDEVTQYCNQQLANDYFLPLTNELKKELETRTFTSPDFDLLLNTNFATDQQVAVLATYQGYVKTCLTQAMKAALRDKGKKATRQERRIVEKAVDQVKKSISTNFLKLAKREITFGEAAELIGNSVDSTRTKFSDQADQIAEARAAAQVQARKEYWARQRKISEDLMNNTQRITSEAFDGIKDANKSSYGGQSSFESNRRRECSLQGKVYLMGACK